MKRERKMELLAPAGNLEIFQAVISAGADAVYFGGDAFGARSYAKNFTVSEAAQAIRFAHLYGKKAFLTVNTLIKNREMEHQLYEFLKAYYEAGIDAVIVQDFGVFSFIRSFFPDLPIHASTQMSVCQAYGARFLLRAGAQRIVAARELSLEEIAQMHRQCGCEIEAFVHGALCVCYSGQCLMSSLIGGRSGNRGKCAQPCRLPYDVLDISKKHLKLQGKYVLSPKDLCALDLIPEMAEAGVYSLKIEGRMKQLSYAAGVVSVYRKYVDRYLEFGKEQYCVNASDRKLLEDLGSRSGFTDAYLRDRVNRKMMTFSEGAHKKEQLKLATEQKKVPVKGIFRAKMDEPMSLTVSCGDIVVEKQGVQNTQRAEKRATSHEEIGQKLRKTGETPFVFEELCLETDADIFLPMAQINTLRQEVLSGLEKKILKRNCPSRKGVLPFSLLEKKKQRLEMKPALPTAADFSLKQEFAGRKMECLVTVQTQEQFEQCVVSMFPTKIAISASLPEILGKNEEYGKEISFYIEKAVKCGKEVYLMLPPVMRSRSAKSLEKMIRKMHNAFPSAGVIAGSYDELGLLEEISFPAEKILLDHRLYTFNNRSVRSLKEMGYRMFTAPYELKETELFHRENEDTFLTVYGRAVLMVTASCLAKNTVGCQNGKRQLFLEDRYKNQFPVLNYCNYCYNEIYNSKVLCLFSEEVRISQMNFLGIRMDFTLESGKETRKVLQAAQNVFQNRELPIARRNVLQETNGTQYTQTKGHWRRGVE